MQKLTYLKESPSQTAGPYVHIGCTPNLAGITGVYAEDLGARICTAKALGQHITVTGCVYDGAGTPLRDAMVEVWQADAAGIYPGSDPRGPSDPEVSGFGRVAGDGDTGLWQFQTIKPGSVPFPDGRMQAPHLTLWIVARGINIGLSTRMYFPEEVEANAVDPILSLMGRQSRAATLLARATGSGSYHFDIHLQGDKETVFFDV